MLQHFDKAATTKRLAPHEIASGPETGYYENYIAASRLEVATNISTSEDEMLEAARQERRDAIARLTGKPYDVAIAPFRPTAVSDDELGAWEQAGILSKEQPGTDLAIKRLRETLGPERAGEILSDDQINIRAKEIALERVTEAADVAERAAGWRATSGQFAGALMGQLHDPLVLSTLWIGPASSSQLLVAAGINAAIGGAVVAAQQPAVQKWRKRLGLPAGVAEAALNVATGAAAGGGFTVVVGGIVKGIVKGIGYGIGRLTDRQKLQAFDELVTNPTPDQRVARDRLEAEVEFAEANPFEGKDLAGDVEAQATHAARAAETLRSLETEGRPADLPEPPPEIVKAPRPAMGQAPVKGAPGEEVYRFDPDALEVDAKRFQFKAGGDAEGVTDALKGVEQFDPIKSGAVLVWEDAQGRRFIADGHQRLGLAKRAKAAGQSPLLTGYMFREADGVTPQMMRAIAASKNIAEGTGSAIDAAKILRDFPELGLNLPPRSALVRDAGGLARLSDDAFGMVVNERVPDSYAALAGRLAPDTETHAGILKILAETKPESAAEAESIIRDVLSAPQVREIQENLFGKAETTQLLYKERAKVLTATARRISQDRAAFSVLLREAGRLEEAGNVLAKEANQARVVDDAQILAILQSEARRKGPLADALATAAKDLKAGASLKRVVERFTDDARRGADETFANRRRASDPGRDGEGGSGSGTDQGGDGGAPPAQGAGGAAARSVEPDSAATRPLDDDRALTVQSDSLPARVEDIPDMADPLGAEATAAADRLELNLRGEIERGNDPLVILDDGAEQLSVSDILADLDGDKTFLDELGKCL